MDLFEDLIKSLEEENLIEENSSKSKLSSAKSNGHKAVNGSKPVGGNNDLALEINNSETAYSPDVKIDSSDNSAQNGGHLNPESNPLQANRENNFSSENHPVESPDSDGLESEYIGSDYDAETAALFEESERMETAARSASAVDVAPLVESSAVDENLDPTDSLDFLRRKTDEEVSALQTVEHIFSGVEREQMKILPNYYNSLEVSKLLHEFSQITDKVKTPQIAELEVKLNDEIQKWNAALLERDKTVRPAQLRRYCATTRPALSSQALVALARFYRNSPFSDDVRDKFELTVTRLLTKNLGNDERDILLDRDELTLRLQDLYTDWSSRQVNHENEAQLLENTVKRFEEFAVEAEKTETYEELIGNNFFTRLHQFKNSIGENFYLPQITAAAVESNVIIGNRYAEIINQTKELEKTDLSNDLTAKSPQKDSAAGKTDELVELLKSKSAKTDGNNIQSAKTRLGLPAKPQSSSASVERFRVEEKSSDTSSKGKFLLAAAVLLAAVLGLLWWSGSLSGVSGNSESVINVKLEDSDLRNFFSSATVRDKKFFAIAQNNWNALGSDTKDEVLKKTLESGTRKGFKEVQVLSFEGKVLATANAEGIKHSE